MDNNNADNDAPDGSQPPPSSLQPSSSQSKKSSFAKNFAFLQNTDMYKLPEKPAQPLPPPPKNTNAIIVNSCQRGNPILKFVKNVPYEYGEIIPDYQLGERHCALFLSLRYHNLQPNYIHERLSALGNRYDLRIILCQVDVKNCKDNLKELSKMCMLAGCTLILAWSAEEAGRYLETYKQYENKPPDMLQERVETDYFSQIQDVLTTVKSVNKTDALTLLSTFGSLRNIINAQKDDIKLCPGFGEQKAQRLYKVFNEPFKRTNATNNELTGGDQVATSSLIKDGKLPPTSKLKRPSEINKRKSDTEEVNGKKHTVEKSPKKKLSASPAKVPKSSEDPTPALTTGNDDDCVITDEVVSGPKPEAEVPTKSTIKEIEPAPDMEKVTPPATSNSNVSLRKKLGSEVSPSKQIVNQSACLSKTQAILNAGLSRYKKHTSNVSPSKVSTDSVRGHISPEKVSHQQVKKQSSTSNTIVEAKRKKPVKVSENPLIATSPSTSSSVNLSTIVGTPETSPKTVSTSPENTVQVKSPIHTSRVLTATGGSSKEAGTKFRVGSRVSRVDPPKDTSASTKYSREITKEEYDDLLASDDDEDEEDMLF